MYANVLTDCFIFTPSGKANGHAVGEKEPEVAQQQPSVITRLIKAFSLYKTLPVLTDTTPKPSQLQSLDAIRFLSMTWVILGHVWGSGMQIGSPSELILTTLVTFLLQTDLPEALVGLWMNIINIYGLPNAKPIRYSG